MDEEFIRNRITELRLKKGVSEYQMSMELGQNRSYIQAISCLLYTSEKVCHFCALQMFFPAQLVQVNDGEQRQIFGFYRFVHSVSSWLL